MEKQFLTKEEIESLTLMSERFDELKYRLGEVSIQKISLSKIEKDLEQELMKLMEEEKTLASSLDSKYGDGSISLQTGEFLPTK